MGAEGVGLLVVRGMAGAVDDDEPRPGDACRNPGGARPAGLVERAREDERRGSHEREAV